MWYVVFAFKIEGEERSDSLNRTENHMSVGEFLTSHYTAFYAHFFM